MDLLSVITHELGHVLGYADLDSLDHGDHVMAGALPVGLRRVSGGDAAYLLAPADLTAATYRSAADRLFDQYVLRDPLFDLVSGGGRGGSLGGGSLGGGNRGSEDRRDDHRSALDVVKPPVLDSSLESDLRPQSDDRLLKRERRLLEQDEDDSHDAYFSELGDEHDDSVIVGGL